ncbi:MAG TPA: aryl-sulfate sulfotransferase [Acidimicrobiia bacterium]|nr:aryl-sulfate sulfotransferase [Acidimicrobiia bacterium]
MLRSARLIALVAVTVGLLGASAVAQDIGPDDPGVKTNAKGAYDAWTLVAPFEQQYTYLIDLDGRAAKSWRTSTRPGLSQKLLEDGTLVRAGNLELRGKFARGQGAGGRIEALAWDGSTLWQKDIASDTEMQHHEIDVLPNGNVIAIVWEYKTADEAIAMGRDPKKLCPQPCKGAIPEHSEDQLWPDKIVEYDPTTDTFVWEWKVWDHLVQDFDPDLPNYVEDVSTRPDRIDINYILNGDNAEADWNHSNGLNYDAARDEIVLSMRTFSEFVIIDHATTTEEAAGPAGDIKFRYGNPLTYGDKKGKRQLFFQHDAEVIEPGLEGAGNIIVFNNGAPEIREFSTVDEVIPERDADGNFVRDPKAGFKATRKQAYPAPGGKDDGELAAIVSSAQRLPNGNTFIADGPEGRTIEVTPKGKIVWDWKNPYYALRPNSPRNSGAGFPIRQNWFFQVDKYGKDFGAFVGKEAQLAPPPAPPPGADEDATKDKKKDKND